MKTSLKLLFFVVTLLLCSACVSSESDKNTDKNGGVEMEEIWKIEDINNFIIALDTHIAQKCSYGENMSVLTEAERVFFVTQSVEMEVNNGGFSQFFYNSSGDFANEIESAFIAIGAVKTAAICKQAVDSFGCAIPSDADERADLLDSIDSEAFDAKLSVCDDAFFAYEEDLNTLNYEYVLAHKDQFS